MPTYIKVNQQEFGIKSHKIGKEYENINRVKGMSFSMKKASKFLAQEEDVPY